MLDHNKIIIVDDEPLNLDILEDLLCDVYQVRSFLSGQDCIDNIQLAIQNNDSLPFLILLDVNMPGLNGLETCKQLKQNADSEKIDIIFVSALVSAQDRIQGYNAGASDYINKPFSSEELYKKIKLTE